MTQDMLKAASNKMFEDRDVKSKEIVLQNLLEVLIHADLNGFKSNQQIEVFDLIYEVAKD